MTAQPMQRQLLTAAEYAALPEDEDTRYELQEGVLVMSPSPIPRHQRCLRVLMLQLVPQLPGLEILQEIDIDLELVSPDQPGTARTPDLVVVGRDAYRRVDAEGGLLRAREALLVVEVFSPGSQRRDSRIKHDEYADAGIGHYWMIDLTDGPSLVACQLSCDVGYSDAAPVRGEFTAEAPFPVRVDLAALVDSPA